LQKEHHQLRKRKQKIAEIFYTKEKAERGTFGSAALRRRLALKPSKKFRKERRRFFLGERASAPSPPAPF